MANSIRFASPHDSPSILEIYKHYVENTAYSFELDVPTESEFFDRIALILSEYPYLVYEIDGVIVGYAYASRFAPRAAYRYSVEVSVYLRHDYQGKGVAAKLYNCIFQILTAQGFHSVFAGVTASNERSIAFHKKQGFTVVGTFHKAGYKFNRWHDVMWLEKALQTYSDSPRPVKLVNALPKQFLTDLLQNN